MTQDHCKAGDFGVFLSLWNGIENYKTPNNHFRIARWLQKCWEHGHRRLLLQAFRGSGKSTLAAIFCAWILCKDPDLRILVLSAESILAHKMVRNIKKVIEKHPMAISLLPQNPDEWASDSFTINRSRISRDPSVLGRGIFANITGVRADIIICDDVEVPNTCDTAQKREDLRTRLNENEFILTPDGTILYIGTPHTYFSIYAKKLRTEIGEDRIFLKNYKRLSIPVLNNLGTSNWPERYSLKKIEDLKLSSGPMKFSSQMMLEPVNITQSHLDSSLLHRYSDELQSKEVQGELVLSLAGKKIVSGSTWWDPSFGKKDNDSSVLAIVYTNEDGDQFLHRVFYITVPDLKDGEDEANYQCKLVAEIAKEFFMPVVAIETNGIGKFLPSLLKNACGQLNINCSVLEQHSTRPKHLRILEAFDAIMAARSLYVHDSVYKTSFMIEMTEWQPSNESMRDDGLDAAAGALSLEPYRIKRIYSKNNKTWNSSGTTHKAKTEFDV